VTSLREFLSARAEAERVRADEKKALQTEWIWAVRRLVQQIQDWLLDADQERLLKIEEKCYEFREVDVGVYSAPALIIRLEADEVLVTPVARMVVGPDLSNSLIHVPRAYGRVDISSGGKKFLLFRAQKDPVDEWVIVEDEGYTVKKFDRESFEEAMKSLLE
jgi:hypothetical protein